MIGTQSISPPLESAARPLAPMTPLLQWSAMFGGSAEPQCTSLFDLPHRQFTGQGRLGIAQLLRKSGIGQGDGVLVPAYHCVAMTAAVRAVGAEPVLCPIGEDLAVSADDALEVAHGRSVKAALIPHLFAWKQSASAFEALRATTQWMLIEDCAHAFFGMPADKSSGVPIGALGDYAIGSLAKFFPLASGGLIASARHDVSVDLSQPGVAFDVKLLVNAIERAADYRRFGLASGPVATALAAVSKLKAGSKANSNNPADAPAQASSSNTGSSESMAALSEERVDPERLAFDGGRFVRWLAARRICERMAAKRLELFDQWQAACAEFTRAHVLPGARSPDFPPYVFPLVLKAPESDFAKLRALGVPMYRWEHIESSNCERSRRYSQSIVQLPCHPGIRADEFKAMVQALTRVLA